MIKIRSIWMGLTAATALALGQAACGGSSTTGSGTGSGGGSSGTQSTSTGGEVDATTACNDFAAAVCDKLDACAPFLVELSYGDAATCKARAGLECPSFFALSGINLTPANLDACASTYANLNCDELFSGKPPAECDAPFKGTGADGTTCSAGFQCVSGSCSITGADGCGVCKHVAAVGEACDPAGGDCGAGTFCNSTTSKCAAVTGVKGSMCGADAPCESQLSCAGGVCSDPAPLGADCGADGPDCDSRKGEFCNPISKKCAKIKAAAVGAECGFDEVTGDITSCSAGGDCVTNMNPKGICKAPTADGAACVADPNKSDPCFQPAQCVNSVCALDTPVCN